MTTPDHGLQKDSFRNQCWESVPYLHHEPVHSMQLVRRVGIQESLESRLTLRRAITLGVQQSHRASTQFSYRRLRVHPGIAHTIYSHRQTNHDVPATVRWRLHSTRTSE